jgi:RHS repeat-associated protein
MWDAAANIVSTAQFGGYIRHNRVTVFEDKRFDYDVHGRLESKRIGSHTEQRFSYNAEHKLIQVETVRMGVATYVRFEYDALGRRIKKYDDFRETLLMWDGMRMLQEQAGSDASTYLYELDSYVPISRVDKRPKEHINQAFNTVPTRLDDAANCEVFYFHTDVSGLPEELTTEDGHLAWHAQYKVWRDTVSESWGALDNAQIAVIERPNIQQNLRFQGQYLDRETALHYNTFRFYDPDIGRFITPDPIGLEGGTNLLQYGSNPISQTDPWGWACSNRDTITRGPNKQILSVRGEIRPSDIGTGTATNKSSRMWARLLGKTSDDAGHTRGNNLGGSGGGKYVFPQDPGINQRDFRMFEVNIANRVSAPGKTLQFEQKFTYGNGGTRPTRIDYKVWDNNGTLFNRTFNNP